MVDHGHTVIFDSERSFAASKASGRTDGFELEWQDTVVEFPALSARESQCRARDHHVVWKIGGQLDQQADSKCAQI